MVAAAAAPQAAAVMEPPTAPVPGIPLPDLSGWETPSGFGFSDEAGDPWKDEPWAGMQWTVFRGQAYDLKDFMEEHPGGDWLLNLALKRDCTALFESSHMRPEVATRYFNKMPNLTDRGFPIAAVPQSPYPNDSDFYNTVRDRVRAELFKGGEAQGAHRQGSEWAAVIIVGYWCLAYSLYATMPNLVTGILLGLGGAWLGLTVQHCGNHGAMSTKVWVNKFLGLMDDLSGGSSLMWRYHHQVSHHIHCNDDEMDEDVFSAYPVVRFDHRMPQRWWHKYQHIYMWFAYPILTLGFHVSDVAGMLAGSAPGATLYGATRMEKASVILGKIVHFSLVYAVPMYFHGIWAGMVAAFGYFSTQGIVLATTFAVSHNVPETKPGTPVPQSTFAGERLLESRDVRDWGIQQLVTSANWGDKVGCFFTGGLNLQIEHHMFPAVSFMHYPAISRIVRDECEKRGLKYAGYPTLPSILGPYLRFMRDVGRAPDVPRSEGGLSEADIARRHALGAVSRL